MKKIGLVGGVGPASTVDYYLGLIELYRKQHGEDVYPEIVIDSVNMNEMISAFGRNDEDTVCRMMLESIGSLKAAGAKIGAITSNTPHIIWDKIKDKLPIPVISIVYATISEIHRKGYKRVLVFGTEFTMASDLYNGNLMKEGILPIIPNEADRKIIGSILYPNLENGIVIPEEKKRMIEVAEKYIRCEKADAMLLGCTEIPLMIKEGDVSVPVLNTTQIHIDAIYDQIS